MTALNNLDDIPELTDSVANGINFEKCLHNFVCGSYV
jgi:hypothetical protein